MKHLPGAWRHAHDFGADRRASERRTHAVIAITLAMMVAEIGAGWWWQSMALLADGWHMGTHAAAIGVAALTYALARRWARDARFSFGPWKVEILGAYTSAVLLAVVAVGIALESALRLWTPRAVSYDESLAVAVVGLLVNLVSARLLHHGHHDAGHAHGHHHDHHDHDHHDHDHAEAHDHSHDPAHGGHQDLNLRAAYLHVLADAATSVLAILALVAGKWAGLTWLDPLVGLLGAVMIALWARGLLQQTARVLLDREMDDPLAAQVRERLQADGDTEVVDLHLTRVGDAALACHVSVVAHQPATAQAYRERLADLPGLAHLTLEVHTCDTPLACAGVPLQPR